MADITRPGNFFDRSGSYTRRIGVYTGPAVYVALGDPFTAAEIALGRIEHIGFSVPVIAGGASAYLIVYDHTNHKAVWYDMTSGNEVGAGTDLSGSVATFEAVGI